MDAVAREVESDPTYTQIIESSRTAERRTVADAIVAAAREIAETADVKAIACFSESGTTALLVSRERTRVPIIALTSLESTARRLSLSWGVDCVIAEPVDRFKYAVLAAINAAVEQDYAKPTDRIVVTAGVPFNTPGSTNILRVAPCQERLIFEGEPE
jgi:pyruvate kinase